MGNILCGNIDKEYDLYDDQYKMAESIETTQKDSQASTIL